MPAAFIVSTKDGDALVISATVKSVDYKEGTPGEPAVEAADAVEDDPGQPADPVSGLGGRPPVKGHPAITAKPAVEAVPSVVTFKTDGGSVEVPGLTLQQAADLINR